MAFDLFGVFRRKVELRFDPTLPPGFEVHVDEFDDEETVAPEPDESTELGYAEGQTFGIEYVDARGRPSTRQITVWDIQASSAGDILLYARCHKREAMRSFRVDRIKAVIDIDGEIHEPPDQFLADVFGIGPIPQDADMAEYEPEPIRATQGREHFETPPDFPDIFEAPLGPPTVSVPTGTGDWMALRRRVRNHAVLLSILAQVDGEVHPHEIDVITAHCFAVSVDRRYSETARNHLPVYLRRMQPSPLSVEKAIRKIATEKLDVIIAFLTNAKILIEIDGQIHDDERQLLGELCKELTGYPLAEIMGEAFLPEG